MRFFKCLVGLLATTAMLSGCGGGSAFQSGSGTTTSTVATISVTASSASIAADGSTTSVITGVLRDKNQNFVSNTKVTFAASAGGLAIGNATSDANGQVVATLSAQGATAGTAIKVTLSVGSISGSTTVNVSSTTRTLTLSTSQAQIPSDGSKSATITALVRDGNNNVVSGVAVQFSATSGSIAVSNGTTDNNGLATAVLTNATDPTNRIITVSASLAGDTPVTIPVGVTGTVLSITGPSATVLGNTSTYTIQLSNSAGAGIPNQAIAVSSSLGNALSAATVTTNATGQATVTLTPSKGGNDSVRATALGLIATQAVTVSSQSFTFTLPAPAPAAPTQVDLNTAYTASVTWSNNGTPVANQAVTFASTRGTLSSNIVNTNASGVATVTVTSANAGPAILTASATGVSAQSALDFIATTPATITLQPSVTAVPTQGSSTILAVVRDASGNLVEGQSVQFVLTDVTNGTLSTGLAVTNGQGIAQTVYTASSSSSAKNGVSITASVLAFPSVTATTTLTVGGQTVFLSLGTGNTINEYSQAEYSQNWAVRAIDAQGATVPNVTVTLGVRSVYYAKGFWCVPGDTGCPALTGSLWYQAVQAECPTEDIAGDGILHAGEDYNNNGKLDPGNVASLSIGSGTTDTSGLIPFQLFYPKDHAQWVQVEIIATAVVTGTQSGTTATVWLPIASGDVNNLQVVPPGVTSPYGVAAVCSNPN